MILEIYHSGEAVYFKHWENVTKIEVENMNDQKPWLITIHIYRFHNYCCSTEVDTRYDWFIMHD